MVRSFFSYIRGLKRRARHLLFASGLVIFLTLLIPVIYIKHQQELNYEINKEKLSTSEINKFRQKFSLDNSWVYLENIKIIDGDTFSFKNNINLSTKNSLLKQKDQTVLRLQGVDTPETHKCYQIKKSDPCNWIKTDNQQYSFAIKASLFVSDLLIKSKTIFFKVFKKDKYERQIARLIVDGSDLSYLLIANGLARMHYLDLDPKSKFYTPDQDFYHLLLNAERNAKKEKIGIWASDNLNLIFPPRSG